MNKRLLQLISSLIVAACPGISVSQVHVVNHELQLLADDGGHRHTFGKAVAIKDGIIAVGAPTEDSFGYWAGAVYLYDLATGQQLMKLNPDDAGKRQNFGTSVALGDGKLIVGAVRDSEIGEYAGAAYVFDALTGSQLFKLLPSGGQAGDRFGSDVATADGLIVVGSNYGGTGNHAPVYVYDAATGNELLVLNPDEGPVIDYFGVSVDIHGGLIVVGASLDDTIANAGGSVYVFDATTGVQVAKLLPDDAAEGYSFGNAVAVYDGIVAAGAYTKDASGRNSGSVYVLNAKTGDQLHKLFPFNADGELFGVAVDLDRDRLVVGGRNSDAAFLYDVSTGDQLALLIPDDPLWFEHGFGNGVGIDGGTVVIGSPNQNYPEFQAGTAYTFDVESICPVDVNRDGSVTPADFTAWIVAFNASAPECDQNNDSSCTPADFTSWIVNFNAGCS